ncbi:hypothetical protein M0R45_025851 [Rubus argutus]|uniref:Uncharacterized protein n=1 Tax=Rubus argutus TaxID=59490 RepID=A0AAW1WXK0_RUBAR
MAPLHLTPTSPISTTTTHNQQNNFQSGTNFKPSTCKSPLLYPFSLHHFVSYLHPSSIPAQSPAPPLTHKPRPVLCFSQPRRHLTNPRATTSVTDATSAPPRSPRPSPSIRPQAPPSLSKHPDQRRTIHVAEHHLRR